MWLQVELINSAPIDNLHQIHQNVNTIFLSIKNHVDSFYQFRIKTLDWSRSVILQITVDCYQKEPFMANKGFQCEHIESRVGP